MKPAQQANAVVSVMNLVIDGSSVPNNLKNILTPSNTATQQPNKSATPADATNVAKPIVPDFIPPTTKKTGTQPKKPTPVQATGG